METQIESIPSLPTELIIQILQHLDYRTLLTCTQVCSLMKTVVHSTASLQYIIELAIRGQADDGYESASSSVDQLRQLNKHTSAWKTLKWSREIRIPKENGGLWELFGGVLGQSTPDERLVFWQLPSDLRGIKERRWTLGPDFGFRVHDFAMDPHQDLLVLIEEATYPNLGHRVHLRTLSTGRPHPLAKETPLVRCRGPDDQEEDETGMYNIQIFGGLIGVLCTPHAFMDNLMAVWDWKTGELLLDIVQEDLDGFSLLSNQYIACAVSLKHHALVVVDFRNGPTRRHRLHEYGAHYFKYPFLDDSEIESIELHADPGNLCGNDDDVPFYQHTENFILVLTIGYSTSYDDMETVRHFIPSQYLISLVETGQKVFDFDWISKNTRMFLLPERVIGAVWVCYVYGTRFVTYEKAPNSTLGSVVRVYDFNQLAVRKDAQGPAQHEASGSIESMPNSISGRPDLLLQDVETTLPYWTNVASLATEGICNVMCSEDSIVIVGRPSFSDYRVWVF